MQQALQILRQNASFVIAHCSQRTTMIILIAFRVLCHFNINMS